MHLLLFLKGIAVGLIISIPIGPMAIICIRRSLQQGFLHGFATSIGIAIGDCIYASLAGFSVDFVTEQVKEHQHFLHLFGGIVILILGIIFILSDSQESPKINHAASLIKTIYTAILLTISNPVNLLAFVALFSWIKVTETNIVDTMLMVSGVFVSAIVWFTILSLTAVLLRTKLTPKMLHRMNKITGALIILLGIGMIFNLF
ncbi:hypothetical protein A3F66_00645 [candidate division TM6 bacterium RIFCSPHIGHO2_12_FULL_32_22]|nr:MAG: hypothetical protein A3F66_00645 [candidate division TM6 bacterium RIFCSPHIGHO2_12_FULL_32_22]